MTYDDQYTERDLTINVSVDNLKAWAIAGIYQGLRQTTQLKNSDVVDEVKDFNWAGMSSLPQSVLPVQLKIRSRKEVFNGINGEEG